MLLIAANNDEAWFRRMVSGAKEPFPSASQNRPLSHGRLPAKELTDGQGQPLCDAEGRTARPTLTVAAPSPVATRRNRSDAAVVPARLELVTYMVSARAKVSASGLPRRWHRATDNRRRPGRWSCRPGCSRCRHRRRTGC